MPDILAVADAAGVDRFAWFGFSFGSVVGLQLASRTNRLSALVCGGWPPLGGQYAETLVYAEEEAAQGRARPELTLYGVFVHGQSERLYRSLCVRA
jgi:pimeloyl-ACP methyl ester carboxylesterase